METTLELRLETPFMTSYNDPDWPLRPHEIWRQWRWWAKALVAGALFDYGLLHGVKQEDAVKVPTQEESECILQILDQLGLNVYSTCFQTRFEEVEFGAPREVTLSFKDQYRLRSEQMEHEDERLWYIDRGSTTLVVEELYPCRLDGRAREAAMGALALALRLSCLGAFGKRGLGCFSVRAYGRYKSLFEEEPEALIRRAVDAVKAVMKDAIWSPVSKCSRLRRREPSPCELPPMPALATRRYDACVKDFMAPYMLFSVKGVRQERLYSFFTHQKTRSYDDFYVDKKEVFKTWIMNGVSNRPSPLMVRIIDNYSAYFNVFVSADWPQELKLEWNRKQVEETDILSATALVLREFVDYVEKIGGKIEVMWPKAERRAEV